MLAHRYKRNSPQNAGRLAAIVRRQLPELGDNDTLRAAAALSLLINSVTAAPTT